MDLEVGKVRSGGEGDGSHGVARIIIVFDMRADTFGFTDQREEGIRGRRGAELLDNLPDLVAEVGGGAEVERLASGCDRSRSNVFPLPEPLPEDACEGNDENNGCGRECNNEPPGVTAAMIATGLEVPFRQGGAVFVFAPIPALHHRLIRVNLESGLGGAAEAIFEACVLDGAGGVSPARGQTQSAAGIADHRHGTAGSRVPNRDQGVTGRATDLTAYRLPGCAQTATAGVALEKDLIRLGHSRKTQTVCGSSFGLQTFYFERLKFHKDHKGPCSGLSG